jgi:hypothetical protein
VLYRLVQQHLETWLARTRESDPDGLPVTAHVERELRGYLTCGIIELPILSGRIEFGFRPASSRRDLSNASRLD